MGAQTLKGVTVRFERPLPQMTPAKRQERGTNWGDRTSQQCKETEESEFDTTFQNVF